MTDYERARKAMVDNQLRTSNVTDRRILGAMGEVPRELFVPPARQPLAYIDEAHVLPGHSGRALGAPAPFAKLVQLANVGPDDTVLDVGAGNGYSAAVLARLAGKVVALESDPQLAAEARATLPQAGAASVAVVEGALDAGAPKQGPYDVIFIEGAVAAVSPKLFSQLKDGGRLVVLLRTGAAAVANVYVRSGDDVAARPEFNTTLPPLSAERPAEKFVF
jgi:protein-L-isoaspartate(D-aspartate) O-methyltransferase